MDSHTRQQIVENVKSWWFGYWMTTFTIFLVCAACVRGCVWTVSNADWSGPAAATKKVAMMNLSEWVEFLTKEK